MTRSRPLVALVLVAGATLAVLCWSVVLLQGSPPAPPPPGERPRPAPRVAPGEPLAPLAPLPAAAAGSRSPPTRVVPEPPRRGPLAVLGRVLDGETGEPVASFQVDVLPHAEGDPLERLAGSAPVPFHRRTGIFQVDSPAGTFDVVVRAPGYEPGVLSGVIVPAQDHRPTDIPLRRGPGIAGRVLSEQGVPVSGVPVFLEVSWLRNPNDLPPRIALAHSGTDGSFSFSPLPPGEYVLVALQPDNPIDRVSGVRVWDETSQVDLFLAPRHRVTVQLRSDRGRPVEGARIELQGGGSLSSAFSNENGLAQLEHVSDGRYALRVTHADFAEHVEELDLAGGAGEELRFLTLVPPEDG